MNVCVDDVNDCCIDSEPQGRAWRAGVARKEAVVPRGRVGVGPAGGDDAEWCILTGADTLAPYTVDHKVRRFVEECHLDSVTKQTRQKNVIRKMFRKM